MLKNVVRMASAGSGKTYTICREAEEKLVSMRESGNKYGKILMLSYANRAVYSIEAELKKHNNGVIPNGIVVMTWYSFLLKEMIKPYQTEIFNINEVKGLNFNAHKTNKRRKGSRERYITFNKNINSEQAAELVELLNDKSNGAVIRRIESIYLYIFIDEFQDLCAYDFEIVEALMKSNVTVTAVGDGKQAIFRTNFSRKNKGKGGANLFEYFRELNKNGIAEFETQNISRRFNYQICNFANRIAPNQLLMGTCMKTSTEHDGVYLIQHCDVEAYYQYFVPVVLKYDKKTSTDSYNSFNFGECKGETYDRVLIYPNGPLKNFLLNGKNIASPMKYYIAVTRPRYSIAFVMDNMPEKLDGFEKLSLHLKNNIEITALRLIPNKKYDTCCFTS